MPARSCPFAGAEVLAEVPLEGVDQRAGPVPLRRVDDHVGRLVHDREPVVLVQHVERDVFRDGNVVRRLRHLDVSRSFLRTL